MTLGEYNAKYWQSFDGSWNHSTQTLLNGWVCLLRYFTLSKDSEVYKDIADFLNDWNSLSDKDKEECTEKYDIEKYIIPLFEKL